jgi:hypothetical protein
LKSDSSVVAWGDNDLGQCDVPLPNTGFVAVSAGANHNLGLKSDGTVVAWGDSSQGQCDVPSPNSGFVAVSAGAGHSLGLKSDSAIVAWGDNDYGQCNVPEPNAAFVAVSAGGDRSLGIRVDPLASVPYVDVRKWTHRIWMCVHPNPSWGDVKVSFGLPLGGDATLRVFDVMGRELARRDLIGLRAGIHQTRLGGEDFHGRLLPSGIYWIHLETPFGKASQRWVVIR